MSSPSSSSSITTLTPHSCPSLTPPASRPDLITTSHCDACNITHVFRIAHTDFLAFHNATSSPLPCGHPNIKHELYIREIRCWACDKTPYMSEGGVIGLWMWVEGGKCGRCGYRREGVCGVEWRKILRRGRMEVVDMEELEEEWEREGRTRNMEKIKREEGKAKLYLEIV